MERESQLIDDAVKVSHIPVTIMQGRYDIVCPPGTAWELYKVILTFNSFTTN
jgi:proline iminopeptidase